MRHARTSDTPFSFLSNLFDIRWVLHPVLTRAEIIGSHTSPEDPDVTVPIRLQPRGWVAVYYCGMFKRPATQSIAIVVLTHLSSVTVASARTPAPLPSTPLPHSWTDVRTGPDGRVWFCAAPYAKECDFDAVRKSIEQAFAEPAPGVVSAIPIAFEHTGRVWFCCSDLTHVMGYDGVNWIEHTVKDGIDLGKYMVSCEAGWTSPGCPVVLRGWKSIEVFDRGNWKSFSYSRFSKERDVVFHQRNGNLYLQTFAMPKLYRWDREDWVPVSGLTNAVREVSLGYDGTIWLRQNNILRRLYLRDEVQSPATPLVRKLAQATDTAEKLAVVNHLQAMEPQDPKVLDPALESTYNAEVLTALLDLGQAWQSFGQPHFEYGDWMIVGASSCAADPKGNFYISGGSLLRRGQFRGSGALMLRANGAVLPLWNVGGTAHQSLVWSTAQMTPDGRAIWVSALQDSQPARRIDLTTGRVDYRLDQPCLSRVAAVLSDGRVIAGAHGGWSLIDPGYPDDDEVILNAHDLEPLTSKSGNAAYAVDHSGMLWLKPDDQPMLALTSNGWVHTSFVPRMDNVRFWRFGQGKDMLIGVTAGTDGRYKKGTNYHIFVHDGRVDHDADVLRLIARQRDAIAVSYCPALTTRVADEMFISLVAESGGRIWYNDASNGGLQHLDGGTWTSLALPRPHGRPPVVEIYYVMSLGNGEQVLLCGDTQSFIAGTVDGELVMEVVGYAGVSAVRDALYSLHAHDGSVWIDSGKVPPESEANGCAPYSAVRVTSDGIVDATCEPSLPTHADTEGNVWFVPSLPHMAGTGKLTIRSHDGTDTFVIVPGATRHHTWVAATGDGHAFVSTPLGMFRLERDPGAPANAYTKVRKCRANGVTGVIKDLQFVVPGCLLIQSVNAQSPQSPRLHLIRLEE